MAANTITLFDLKTYQPIASGSSLIYTVQFADENGTVLLSAAFQVLTLAIADTDTGVIINSIDEEDLLTSDRATFADDGTLTIIISPDETALTDATKRYRSLILTWQYGTDHLVGRHQANFLIVQMAGDGT